MTLSVNGGANLTVRFSTGLKAIESQSLSGRAGVTTRRRFLGSLGTGAGLAGCPWIGWTAQASAISGDTQPESAHRGRGRLVRHTRACSAFGAEASVIVLHESDELAARAIDSAMAELPEVEKLLSLDRPDSALRRLNHAGVIKSPHPWLVQILQKAIRCGQCYQACPNNVLQPLAFEQGLDGLWTPRVVARRSGCEPSCNNRGQVCRTGAIRSLPIEEKRVARMGLAVVNEGTCLPYAQREACQLCVDECQAARYDAIEFQRVGTRAGADGVPIDDSGFLAPVVLVDKCAGCGLCETRCFQINVKHKRLLADSAITIVAGPGKEDRLRTGSCRRLRESERGSKARTSSSGTSGTDDGYLPDFLK
jgi:ferredoxin